MRRFVAALFLVPFLAMSQAAHSTPAPPIGIRVADAPLGPPKPPAPRLSNHSTAHAEVYGFIKSRYGERTARRFAGLVVAKAEKYALPPLLVAKIINRESSFRPHVELHGCYGLMQVARFHFKPGQNPRDPATNLEAGCRVLASYHKRFRSWPRTLTAYNFGPGATVSRGLRSSRYARQVLAGR